MPEWLLGLQQQWSSYLLAPLIVIIASVVVAFWARRVILGSLRRWAQKTRWEGTEIIVKALNRPIILWGFLLGVFLGLQMVNLPPRLADLSSRSLLTLLVVSATAALANTLGQLAQFYGRRLGELLPLGWVARAIGAAIYFLGILLVLEIWGLPTAPLAILVAAALVAAVFAFREPATAILLGLGISRAGEIKKGDWVKLEGGAEGTVWELSWRGLWLEGLEGDRIFIPHSRLFQTTLVNYGQPRKTAKEPFRFYTRLHLKELTGLKVRNLPELVAHLKKVPEAVIYYHTHHFLEEHQYLTPEPANDFALWVQDALGEEVLADRLASVDVLTLPTLEAVRQRLVDVIEEYMAQGGNARQAAEGREFYFIKSISLVFPLPYTAHDLRDFVGILQKLSISSLYFHIFEARYRHGRGRNDFSVWLEESLEEPDLALKLNRLDPYNTTLEGLRSQIIALVEGALR